MEQFAAGAKFEDDVVVLARFGEVNQLDDVGVVKLTHDLDFLEDVRSLQVITSAPVLYCHGERDRGERTMQRVRLQGKISHRQLWAF